MQLWRVWESLVCSRSWRCTLRSMTQHDGELEELEAAIPDSTKLDPWFLLGWLRGGVGREGAVTLEEWNEAVAAAEARWAEYGR